MTIALESMILSNRDFVLLGLSDQKPLKLAFCDHDSTYDSIDT